MNVKLEVDLTGAVEDYAMYTDLGNAAVHAVVTAARANSMTWSQTVQALRQLSNDQAFGEAMDTMVRECVYHAIGADKRNESFYV